jgi:hypothetical protein
MASDVRVGGSDFPWDLHALWHVLEPLSQMEAACDPSVGLHCLDSRHSLCKRHFRFVDSGHCGLLM